MTKPTVATAWATDTTNAGASGNLNKEVPTPQFQQFGQPEGVPTDRPALNYILNAFHQWITYFETVLDDLGYSLINDTTAESSLSSNKAYIVDTSSGDLSKTLPLLTDLSVGDTFKVIHLKGSSNIFTIANTLYGVNGLGSYDIPSGTPEDIQIESGERIELVYRGNSILEVIG